MSAIYILLGVLAGIGGIICSLIILIDAFRDEVWKGFVSLLCGFYFLYYALFEFEHDNKWQLIIGSFAGSAIATGFFRLAGVDIG